MKTLQLIARLPKSRWDSLRLCCLALTGLASCSPYNFSKEVGAVSTGIDQLYNGFTSGYTALAGDRAALAQLDLTGARAKVAIASSCLVPAELPSQNQTPCELYRFGTTPPELSDIERL